MPNEIQVGEYVRTPYFRIEKVERIDKADNNIYEDIVITDKSAYGLSWLEIHKTKHSSNIIDLIEVGDYVNGREVKHIAMFEGFPDYPKLIFVDEKHLILGETAENKDIKSIVTKEQFASMEYKMGG